MSIFNSLRYHLGSGSRLSHVSEIRYWTRWIFKRCLDCGCKLRKENFRGDSCDKCFEEFNGMTMEEIFGSFTEQERNLLS